MTESVGNPPYAIPLGRCCGGVTDWALDPGIKQRRAFGDPTNRRPTFPLTRTN